MSTGYQVLVLFHLLCAIGGFGLLAYRGLFANLARRRGSLSVLETGIEAGGLAELLIYGAFVFGVAAVGESGGRYAFSQPWVAAAFAVFLVLVGWLHGFIRPAERRLLTLGRQLAGPVPGGDDPKALVEHQGRLSEVERIERRVGAGWGVFNLTVVAVVCLMVFKPGA